MYCGNSCFDFYDGDIKMNNRIKELWNRSNHDEEVFAELIVKECAEIGDGYDNETKYNQGLIDIQTAGDEIRKHFGVEE